MVPAESGLLLDYVLQVGTSIGIDGRGIYSEYNSDELNDDSSSSFVVLKHPLLLGRS
jgi:hypothetical protein